MVSACDAGLFQSFLLLQLIFLDVEKTCSWLVSSLFFHETRLVDITVQTVKKSLESSLTVFPNTFI